MAMLKVSQLLIMASIVVSVIATAPSFCKCTCFTNSTIIPLSSHAPSVTQNLEEAHRTASVGCLICNKAFCLSQRLPICKDAEEKDVVTICFQRDSTQDKVVVYSFITATLGLLGWAGVRRVVEKRKEHYSQVNDI
ncbi:BgTH12-07279 [Blumeria graminis f. sp. triticale]|uniref:BgTH12-07279 n=1 Tax=Blumeria graminis f. sp. triticale TaxID=1689686 RepID=A0A9W4D904_BLUGR|nr:BgTH12-07279 [Blumeria graminis f. sp. triticale]